MTKMYDLPALSALRNRLEMGLDEPAASFASRLAVRNGVDSAQSLCQQILFKLDGLRLGDEKAIGFSRSSLVSHPRRSCGAPFASSQAAPFRSVTWPFRGPL